MALGLPQPAAFQSQSSQDATKRLPTVQPEKRIAVAAQKTDALAKRARWSADGWLLLRESETARNAAASAARAGASLGGSQIGAVLRYRLTNSDDGPIFARPALYARASQALTKGGESELALGIQAQPVAALPVTAHIEARVTKHSTDTEIRPAAFVTTGFYDVNLPAGITARGYGQAGYVGGDFATPFADGQVVADKAVATFDLAGLDDSKAHIGAGVWAGAQKGVSRVDVGPQASITVKIGKVPARLSASYRVRVAGNAAPANSAAVTLSAGF